MKQTMKAGDFIRLFDRKIWYVVRISESSAFLMPLTGKQRAITTRKGVTKMVTQRSQGMTISPSALVEILDPNDSALNGLREYVMADGEKKQRARRVYVRTEKETKNLKGQGAIILAAIEHFGQATAAQIVEHTKGQYPTRQPEERVVGFYLSKFKREGLVKDVTAEVVKDAETEAAERAEADQISG